MEGLSVYSYRVAALISGLGLGVVAASELETPQSPAEDDFSALREASPFVRVLDPSETFALRGVARVDDVSVATLYNRKTKKTFQVTPESEGDEGMKLVEIERNPELEGVKARVSFAGEEVELIYDPQQFASAPRTGPGAVKGKGPGGDKGKRRGPSKEELDRYRNLSPEKQKTFQSYVRHVMKEYPNMAREERGNMLRGALIRLTDGQELDFQPAPANDDN